MRLAPLRATCPVFNFSPPPPANRRRSRRRARCLATPPGRPPSPNPKTMAVNDELPHNHIKPETLTPPVITTYLSAAASHRPPFFRAPSPAFESPAAIIAKSVTRRRRPPHPRAPPNSPPAIIVGPRRDGTLAAAPHRPSICRALPLPLPFDSATTVARKLFRED